jgi:exodeoxyribonuclease V gamma subunit
MSDGTAMYQFRIYKSNKLENFLPEVCRIIRRLSQKSPLKKKSIVVQSDGMARWLTLKAVSDTGAFANFDFVSPDGFLRNFAEEHFGITADSIYNKKNAEWVLYSQLRNIKTGPVWKYIGENDARAFRFSRTLADLFEQYFVYRPKMIDCWQRGKTISQDSDELWQFEIFRKLDETTNTNGFAQLFNKKCEEASLNDIYPDELILFGISIMNRYQLDMFRNLSRLFPIHLFAMSPSQEFYQKSKQTGAFLNPEENEGEFDTFFGRFCAASLDFLSFSVDNFTNETDFFEDPEGETLLSFIQKDILHDSEEPENAGFDDSVKIISCRDKMREIEVLKDNLLELFNKDADLKPEDVAVMAPKINDYVPYITAVFGGTDSKDKTFVPWVISDRTFSSESRIASTFLEILRLGKSDFEKSKVFSIFRSPFVCAKFNTDGKVVDDIEKLVSESGVRWGLDAKSRGEECEGTAQNTWDFGLSRIIMSFVMPFSENGECFEGILPMESASKEDFDNMSGFISFVKELFRYSREFFSYEKSPAEFKNLLESALDSFFLCNSCDSNAREELRYIRSVIDDFAETASGQNIEKLSFDALMQYLEDELGRERSGRGFLSAKVNFCSLKPLRALPFKVIYLVGMGDGEFPRSENRYSFDLTQKKSMKENNAPLPRSVRDNDKYLFVEAIVSARQQLFISYEAKDLSEDSKKRRRAALPVQILEKYIEKKTTVTAEKQETKYPVQPFSEEYFKGGEFKTFSKKDFEIAKVLAGETHESEKAMFHVEQNASNLEAEQVSEQKTGICESAETEVVDLEKLVSFCKDPIKFHLTKTLKIALPDDSKEKGDEELFDYSDDNLLGYNIRQTYIDMAQNDPEEFLRDSYESFFRRMRGEGKMPFGVFGEAVLKEEVAIQTLHDGIKKIIGADLAFKDFSLDFPELHLNLQGRTQNIDLSKGCVIFISPSKLKMKYKIEVLIRHLAANADGLNADTYFFFKKESGMLEKLPVEEAKGYLFWFLKLWLTKSRMQFFDPDLIENLVKNLKDCEDVLTEEAVLKEVASFFEEKWVKRNDEHSQTYPETLLGTEQFLRQEKHFLSEFPSMVVLETAKILKKFFYTKKGRQKK